MTHKEAFEILKSLPNSIYYEEVDLVEVQLTSLTSVKIWSNSFTSDYVGYCLANGGEPLVLDQDWFQSVMWNTPSERDHFLVSFWDYFFHQLKSWDEGCIQSLEQDMADPKFIEDNGYTEDEVEEFYACNRIIEEHYQNKSLEYFFGT